MYEKDVLQHYGMVGMRWGVRKAVNAQAGSFKNKKGTAGYRQERKSATKKVMMDKKFNSTVGRKIATSMLENFVVSGVTMAGSAALARAGKPGAATALLSIGKTAINVNNVVTTVDSIGRIKRKHKANSGK